MQWIYLINTSFNRVLAVLPSFVASSELYVETFVHARSDRTGTFLVASGVEGRWLIGRREVVAAGRRQRGEVGFGSGPSKREGEEGKGGGEKREGSVGVTVGVMIGARVAGGVLGLCPRSNVDRSTIIIYVIDISLFVSRVVNYA